MTNQAAQTMPSNIVERLASAKDKLPAGSDERVAVWRAIEYFRAISQTEVVAEGWKLVPVEPTEEMVDAWTVCNGGPADCYRSMLAAAPAASGGEQCTTRRSKQAALGEREYEAKYATPERLAKPAATSDCDFCGVRPGELHAFDCTALDDADEPQPPAAASVSERARELLAAEYERDGFDPVGAQQIREGFVNNTTAMALRALEQALAQQRGERFSDDIRAFGACFMLDGQRVDPERIFYTTHQPSADAVREVPDGMVLVPREPTPKMVRAGAIVTDHVTRAIQVYSAMLSAASDHQQNAAQGGGEK